MSETENAPVVTTAADVYRLFFRPGEVVEVRALGVGGKSQAWDGSAYGDAGVFGYFDNETALTKAILALSTLPQGRAPSGVYFTPNPPIPALLARATNRLVASGKKRPTTSDHEIKEIRWLMVDLDVSKSVRPAGISSTAEELQIAASAARDLLSWTKQQGWPDPIKGFSGNGYHLVWRIQTQPPNKEAGGISGKGGLIYRCLHALDAQMRKIEPRIDVDRVVYNAARIWKFYGTWARKGDHVPDRPHRRSRLLWAPAPNLDGLPKVTTEQLEALAALAPADEPRPAAGASRAPAKAAPRAGKTRRLKNELGPLDIGAYLEHYGVAVHKVERKGSADWYVLENCIFDSGHRAPDAAIVQDDGGRITYSCFHNSCEGRTWHDARAEISGRDNLAPFCENYQAPAAGAGGQDGDTRWDSGVSAGDGVLRSIAIVPSAGIDLRPDGLPAPDKIHPQEFFDIRGKRERFVVRYAANYLAAWFAPLVFTEGMFFHYKGGVWGELSQMQIRQALTVALAERVQAAWVREALDVLSGLVHREEDDWPQYPSLINVANGMIDMDRVVSGEIDDALIPHDPKYGSRIQLPVNYDPDAGYDEWFRYLDAIFNETDAEGRIKRHKHELLQQFVGYILLPTCKYERCLFCYGTGANGKSTFLNTLESVIGPENTVSVSIEELGHRFNVPYLRGKLLNVASEVETREPTGTQMFKKCISGDLIMGELKFGQRVKFRNMAKFIFAMNNPPSITDRSHGFQRKVIVVNFNRRFEEHEMDRDLADKLAREKPGILMWALQGAASLVSSGGFKIHQEIEEEQHQFMATVNPLIMFVDECCEMGAADYYRIQSPDLYEAYCKWIDKGRQKALGRNNFYQTLLSNYPSVRRGKLAFGETRAIGFSGIRLRGVM